MSERLELSNIAILATPSPQVAWSVADGRVVERPEAYRSLFVENLTLPAPPLAVAAAREGGAS